MIEDKPNIKLIDEDKTVTISMYTYNKLLFDSFKLETAKELYDVTKAKLDNLYNYIMKNNDSIYLSERDRQAIKNLYYGIEESIKDN